MILNAVSHPLGMSVTLYIQFYLSVDMVMFDGTDWKGMNLKWSLSANLIGVKLTMISSWL